jgi:hypothetical protein
MHTQNSAKQTPRPVLFNAHINAAPSFLGAQHHVVDGCVLFMAFSDFWLNVRRNTLAHNANEEMELKKTQTRFYQKPITFNKMY